MKTNLKGLYKNFRKKNWSGYWSLDGKPLSNSEAHTFVVNALNEGYECDADVPDDLVRKWLGR